MFTPARRFSTAAKVYPSYLPHLPHSRRMPFRWFKPLAALVAVGLGVRTYAVNARERRTIAAAHDIERHNEERRRQHNLMEVYGSRDSLEDLENAIRFYEKK
ncbi:unnamed protein product [Clonostachys byssicola]|uniref:Uncharacterized protein n=1 Tax=Clonostachys byssicola TaxID=160290 RepID=A0A9N9XVZ5_9HYPO|nr:unnamed protein product [Clonostachys byssicola]